MRRRVAYHRYTANDRLDMHSKLERGRDNGVVLEQFTGPNPTGLSFDPQYLWSYLIEQAELQYPMDMDGVISMFNQEFHQLPEPLDANARAFWERLDISDAPDGDDIKQYAAVSEFVVQYTQYYATHDGKAPLDESPTVKSTLGDALLGLGRIIQKRAVPVR